MPKVSICIPTYNQVTFLKLGLESILSQTYQDYEVIITDDSDNDNVKKLIDTYNFNGKLHYYRNDLALGSPKNWNYCISKARGEYIKIIHHDDWFSSNNSLQKLVDLLESDKNNNFAFCGCNNMSIDGINLFKHSITLIEASIIKTCPEFLFFNNRIGAPSVTIFKKVNFFFDENIKFLVDIEFYINILNANSNFSYTTEALINIGHSAEQVTNTFINNKNALIYEYSYTYNKLNKNKGNFKWYFDAFWNLFTNLNIKSSTDLKNYNWNNKQPRFIIYIINTHHIIETLHLKKLQRIFRFLLLRYFKYVN